MLLLSKSLKPNRRVIADLVRQLRKQELKHITIQKNFQDSYRYSFIVIEPENLNKTKAQLQKRVEAIRMETEPPVTRPFSHSAARAESDKALALAARLKAEQAELARKAALVPPRRIFNTSVLEHLPRHLVNKNISKLILYEKNVNSDQLWKEIVYGEPTAESKAFWENLRKRVRSGQDSGGVYLRYPDGRKEYKKSPNGNRCS